MTVERVKDLITQYDGLIQYRRLLLDYTVAEEFLSVLPTCVENQETLEALLQEKTSECQRLRIFLQTAQDKIVKLYTQCQANNHMREFLDFANFLSPFFNSNGGNCLASNLVDKNSHQFYHTSLNECFLEELGINDFKQESDIPSNNQITTEKCNRLNTFSIVSDEDILTLNSKLEKIYELFDAEILRRKQAERERNDLELLSKKLYCLLLNYQRHNCSLDEATNSNTQISGHQFTITEDISNEIYSAIQYDLFSGKVPSLILPAPIDFRNDISAEINNSNELSGKFEAELIVPDVISKSSIWPEIQNHTDVSTLPFSIIQPPQACLQSTISSINIDRDSYSNQEFRNSSLLTCNYESTSIESGKTAELDFVVVEQAENVSTEFLEENEEISNKVTGKLIFPNNELPSSTIAPQEAYFDCDFCGKSFLKKVSMHLHRRVHMKTDPAYDCGKCGNSYPRKNEGQKLIKCPVCDAPEPHNSHGDSNVHCTICNRSFAKGSTLIKHKREVHNETRPYKCSECDKCFPKKNLLTNHFYVHRQKSFECSICNQRFKHLSNQRRHVKVVHERAGLLQCAHCNERFGFKKGLITHIHSKHFSLHTAARRFQRYYL